MVMARPLRLDLEGGWYHVINRGLEKRRIFPNERTNLHFLELLSVLPTRFGLKIHGYVLMGNHYHLQIETPKANLSQAIPRAWRRSLFALDKTADDYVVAYRKVRPLCSIACNF
jgi:REP element-mobilizing transposase RayT